MPVLKKHLTPIGRSRQIVKHAGKGAVAQPLPGAAQGGYASNMNDYSQATPMANPSDDGSAPPATPSFG
jgi:hypothetical protein